MTWALYVHVPFCRARCPYCAFTLVTWRDVPWARFVDRLIDRIAVERPLFGVPPSTLYLGGGTPSRMPGVELRRLLDSVERQASAEVTVEANPEDVDENWVHAASAAGVTRVSLGVQSFQSATAKVLGREHSRRHAAEAIKRVADSFPTWSIDLMFGVEQGSGDSLDADIDAVLSADAPHVSAYGLTIEPGTRFGEAKRGRRAVDDEAWRVAYDRLVERTRAAGLHRYEVSNFARAGHQSQHNRVYWTGLPYAGVGPGAHGFRPTGERTAETDDVAGWLSGAALTEETPTARVAAVDRLWPALRLVEGLNLNLFGEATGYRPHVDVVNRLHRGGALTHSDGHLALTDAGFAVADGVGRALVDALVPVDTWEKLSDVHTAVVVRNTASSTEGDGTNDVRVKGGERIPSD